MTFKKEERVEQICACCDTIKSMAKDIVELGELYQEINIAISIPCNAFPTIEVEKTILSKQMLERMRNNE